MPCNIKDPYVYGSWTFNWYPPGQNFMPPELAAYLNLPIPTAVPFKLSNKDEGRSVRFQSLEGAFGPQYVSVDQKVPFLPGSISKFINVEESEVDLRLLITADSQLLLWARLREMAQIFQPQRGIGTLEVLNPSDSTASPAIRRLDCRCISGFRVDSSTMQEKSVEASLTFWANNPYWYGGWELRIGEVVQARQSSIVPGTPSTLVGAPGQTVYRFAINNVGDVNTFPVMTVDGPFSQPLFFNQSINPNFSFNNVMSFKANGGSISPPMANPPLGPNVIRPQDRLRNPLVVDCQNKLAYVQGIGPPTNPNVPQFNKLTRESSFFYLQPGTNIVLCTTDIETLNTDFKIYWRPAFSTIS